MSTVALDSKLSRTLRFYDASIGKKAIMAVTGVILFGYILGHMLGNLQIFAGPERINAYARFLHSQPALLWGVRLLLLASVILHILSSVQLWLLKRRARPIAYYKKDDVPASYAARTMMWSGPIIGAFVVFHILHLTAGTVGLGYRELEVYNNVVQGFRHPEVAIAYIIAMTLLCLHLYHGLWSMFQSVGINHPRYTPLLKRGAALFAWVVALGFISVPVSVLAGWIG
jgi:succinate dehydrogenase / fumarate reductase, cytochrome b subunit